MKKILIFAILISLLPTLYAQNKDGLYTKESIEKLLHEGSISNKWKNIFLNMAEDIDRGNFTTVINLDNRLVQRKVVPETPNEKVLYGALLILYALYSYDPVAGVLHYNIVPSFDKFNKASEKIRAFYAQVGIVSLYLLQWDDLFPKNLVKEIASNNSYFYLKIKDYKTYSTLYSEIYEVIIQTDEKLSNLNFVLDSENKELNIRIGKKKIVAKSRNIIDNIYGDLVQEYPFSPLPHLIYFKALAYLSKWQSGIYQEYQEHSDYLEHQKIVNSAKIEIQKAFDIKEIPLTIFYQTENVNDKDLVELYQKWLDYFVPDNLYALGDLITELARAGKFAEAEARLKAAKKLLRLIPIGYKEGMAYYFALISFVEMTLAFYEDDYEELADLTPKTIELSQDFPIVLRKIAGIFSNTPFMQKAGKQVGAKFYLDNFIQGGYKAAKRITEIYPESDYLAADIFNLSFYEFMRLDESDVAYQELVKIAENKLSMSKNTANQVKDLYYRIVKYYTPPGGVPEDVKKYFGVD